MSVDPFSRYELLARLGQGGMGVVHRARDRDTGRDVAVKISEAPADDATAQRQLREARHSMSVKNRHICSVLAAGRTPEGNTYLVMDLVDGPSLVDVARRRRLPPSLWLEALRALAEALTAVHAQHIIHRDVKPQNVMFDARGVLKLLDFGIARSTLDDTVTGTGEIIGTAAYMSPEQARAETLDGRSDLFSAALTIATFASRGASRFANTKLDIGQKVVRAGHWLPPPLMELDEATPPEIEDLFTQLLTLRPEERVATADDVIRLVEGCRLRHPEGEQLFQSFIVGAVDDAAACAFDADREIARARALPHDLESQVARVLALRRAMLLHPSPQNAHAFHAEAARHRFRFDEDFDAEQREFLATWADRRAEPARLRAASESFRRSGHIGVAVPLLWHYVRVQPHDIAAVRLLDRSVFGVSDKPTLSIARGIKTGGLAAQARAKPNERFAVGGRPTPSSQSQSQSPSTPLSSSTAAPMSSRAASDEPRGLPLAAIGGTVVVALLIVLLLLQVARTARTEMKAQDDALGRATTEVVVDERVRLVDAAAASYAAGDDAAAIDAATRALDMNPSLDLGRRALLVRARAYHRQKSVGPTRRDLELYLERATDFADPNLAEVKRILRELDAGDAKRE